MPRYAKGSLEGALYYDLKREADDRPAKPTSTAERRNSAESRAHRLEQGVSGISASEKVRGIKVLGRLHDNRWITDENFLNVVSDILKGE